MKIGIIGSGMIGSTVGRLWVDAGHEVLFASRHPDDLKPLVEKLGKRASAGTVAEAARFGEVVLVSVPLAAIPALALDVASPLTGKIVLDTGNAYEKPGSIRSSPARSRAARSSSRGRSRTTPA